MSYVFKIKLRGLSKPCVWRRISVPENLTFAEFHLVIQSAFGWTNTHLYEFVDALSVADRVYSVDIYSARETDTLGVSAELIADMLGEKGRYCPSFEDTAKAICEEAHKGDIVVVMGAGDIWQVFEHLDFD